MKVFIIFNADNKDVCAVSDDSNRAKEIAEVLSATMDYPVCLREYDTEDYGDIMSVTNSWFVSFNESGKVIESKKMNRPCGEYFCDANGAIDVFVMSDRGKADAIRIASEKRSKYLSKKKP